jgi:hypothetical protein
MVNIAQGVEEGNELFDGVNMYQNGTKSTVLSTREVYCRKPGVSSLIPG